MSAATAGALVAAAVLVAGSTSVRRHRIGWIAVRSPGRAKPARPVWWLAAAGSLAGVAWGGWQLAAVLALVAAVSWTASRLVQSQRGRRDAALRSQRCVALCDALVAELVAGQPTGRAMTRACSADGELAPVGAAATYGGDVAAALRRCSGATGAGGLRAVAAAWAVATTSGAPLAPVLERVADTLRAEADARAEVEGALAPPRATARILAVLPAFGLGLGAGLGADPVAFLIGTPLGMACLAGGLLLAGAGLWWVERLASAAEVAP